MSGFTLDLNAPYGARCFLTLRWWASALTPLTGLNAPYGARCFLTQPSSSGLRSRSASS